MHKDKGVIEVMPPLDLLLSLVIVMLLLLFCIRLVDMQHVLVQQLEKRADVLAVVKERILTTSPCSVTLRRKQQCGFHGVLSLLSLLGNTVRVRLFKSL